MKTYDNDWQAWLYVYRDPQCSFSFTNANFMTKNNQKTKTKTLKNESRDSRPQDSSLENHNCGFVNFTFAHDQLRL